MPAGVVSHPTRRNTGRTIPNKQKMRDIDKILELDRQLEAIPGLRYKVDRNHDLVYLEMDETAITLPDLRAMFRKIGLEPRFIGAVPDEMRSKSRTQPLAT